MEKKETRFERDKRMLLWAINTVKDEDRLIEGVLEVSNRAMFEKTFPHVGRELEGIYETFDSVAKRIFELEDRVEELEKQLSEQK